MDNLIVDFAGVSSSGKTSVIESLERILLDMEYNVCSVDSVSRFLGEQNVNISEKTEVFTQAYISLINWITVFEASYKHNIVLTTDLGVRSTAYLLSMTVRNQLEKKLFDKLVYAQFKYLKMVSEKSNHLHFYLPKEFPLVADGIRCVDDVYHNRMDNNIVYTYKRANIPFITLTGSIEERVAKALEIIEETDGII